MASAVGRSRSPAGGGPAAFTAAATAALTVVLTVSACGAQADNTLPITGMSEHNDDGMNGAVLADQYVMADVTLTATDGSPYSLTRDTTGPLTLVFFGYTHCPDICSAVMSDIASAMTRLNESDRERVAMLFVTTDPARDDPQVLREYLDRFDISFEGVTGDLAKIVEAGDALGVEIERGAKLPSGGYSVAHGTQIVAIDEDDRAPIVWTEGTSADDLAEDITELLNT